MKPCPESSPIETDSTTSTTASATVTPQDAQTSPDSPIAPQGLCLDRCDTPQQAQFSFGLAKPITPDQCRVKKMKTLDNTLGLSVFYLADCGSGDQLYLRTVSYDSSYQSSAQWLSTDCFSSYTNVIDFAADMGTDGPLVAYRCSSSELKIVAMDRVSQVTGKSTLGRDFSHHKDLYVTWNATASSFGLITYGSLLRLDSKGRALGGSTSIANSSSSYIDYVTVQDGSWLIITAPKYYWNSFYCSKVSPLGLPQCNEQEAYEQNNGRPLGNTSLSVYQSNFYRSAFDPATCTMRNPRNIGQINDESIASVYNVVSLQDNLNAVLFTSSAGTLQIGIYGGPPPGALLSLVSVADLSHDAANPQLQLLKNRFLVSYVSNSQGYLGISDIKAR